MIKKLQHGINNKFGAKILVNKQQFYSEDADRPITEYIVKTVVWDENKGRNTYIELFSSCSQIQTVLWLRDYWYELNGWEVPTDNPIWTKEKEKYYQKIEKKKTQRAGVKRR